MSLVQKAFVRLPDGAQLTLSGLLARTGLLPRVPLFAMFMRSLEFMGADPAEMRRAMSLVRGGPDSFAAAWRTVGNEAAERARSAEAAETPDRARALYFRAALYFLLADWIPIDRDASAENYRLALPCFDRFRELSSPAIDKVDLPFDGRALKAHFRLPTGANGPCPAVVIYHGLDETKEMCVAYENAALARGIATLSVDQPGVGESALAGIALTGRGDVERCARASLDHLQQRGDVRPDAIGVFGMSLGGFYAPCSAALDRRFAAVAGIGGPFDLARRLRDVAAIQRMRVCQMLGVETPAEIPQVIASLDPSDVLPEVRCPALVVHGTKDELIPVADARALAQTMGGPTELRLVEGGDHACSRTLATEIVPYIFDWFAEQLR